MRMNNFVNHSPEAKAFGVGVQYFCDDKGRDFYDSRDLFTKKYTVFFDSHGVIRAAVKSTEVTKVNPLGLSAVDLNTLPKDFVFPGGTWIFDGKKVVSADVDPAIPTSVQKAALSKKLAEKILPYADAVDLGEATAKEEEIYKSLRRLRVQLMRIDDSTPPGKVDWSEYINA